MLLSEGRSVGETWVPSWEPVGTGETKQMKNNMLVSAVAIIRNTYKKISNAFVGHFWLSGRNFRGV